MTFRQDANVDLNQRPNSIHMNSVKIPAFALKRRSLAPNPANRSASKTKSSLVDKAYGSDQTFFHARRATVSSIWK